jgi:S1-C subfamily serine protease
MNRSTEPPGILVEQVIAESPAAHAGIQPYDIIVRFNGCSTPKLAQPTVNKRYNYYFVKIL